MDNKLKDSLYDLFVNKGVYGKIKNINFSDFYKLTLAENLINSVDLFCPNCNVNKTFVIKKTNTSRGLGETFTREELTYHHHINEFSYECPTCKKILYIALFYNGQDIIKISQYPSLYDVSRDELKKYKSNDLINEENFNQIYKADICASESYFIAAFAYMRRVYETLMLSVFHQHESELNLTIDEFKKLSGQEKIKIIRPYLAIDEGIYGPLYSLLSGGIHEYTEDECSKYYSFLKLVLLDVLREQKSRNEREANRKAIMDLRSKIKAK